MAEVSANGVLFVLGLAVAAVSFILLVFAANRLLAPARPTAEKLDPFECGMPPAGPAHGALNLRFSTVALLFVLFDAEAVLLFAVGPLLRGSLAGVVEVGAFVILLAGGLGYAWRKGALRWPS
jgi:NADH-quinone oxidoreductase subunit A